MQDIAAIVSALAHTLPGWMLVSAGCVALVGIGWRVAR